MEKRGVILSGRKSKYATFVEPKLDWVREQVENGIIEEEIAKGLGISVATLNNYKNQYKEFAEALSQNKGKQVLQKLINAGIEAATGYFKEEEITTVVLDENGDPVKRQKMVTKRWFPPNATLNRYYVSNFGKEKGFTNDPLDYELRKAKFDLDKIKFDNENWSVDDNDI